MSALSAVLEVLGWLLAVPAFTVLLLVVAGLFGGTRRRSTPVEGRIAVLIPAHDEASQLKGYLESVLSAAQGSEARVIVVADNCSDRTAEVAAACGAEVWERSDMSRRGKPAALEWALDRLASNPPDVVVFLDADCTVDRGTIAGLAGYALATGRPAQGHYLMPGNGLRSLALLLKGVARHRGLSALGAPVHIQGTGFAVPWALLQAIPMPTDTLVEDMEWGCAFARAGKGVVLDPEFAVSSPPPRSREAQAVQQTRWEHGTIGVLFSVFPRQMAAAVQSLRPGRILHALDVGVPPLSLLALSLSGVCALALLLEPESSVAALSGLCALALAVMVGWFAYGRKEVGLLQLLAAPWYAAGKILFYAKALVARESGWKRTPRS